MPRGYTLSEIRGRFVSDFKHKYLTFISQELMRVGIKINRINIQDITNPDFYADYFDAEYRKNRIKIALSIRGASLRLAREKGYFYAEMTDSYTVESFINKLNEKMM